MAGIRRENHPAGRRKGPRRRKYRDIRSHRWIFWTGRGRPHWESLRAVTAPLTSPPSGSGGGWVFRPGGAGRGAASQGADPGQRSGAGGGPWKPGHDAGRRRPAGGGQHPHHPPSHRRYAQQHFSGFRPVAARGTGVLGTTGVESAEAVRGLVDRAPSVGGHRRGRAGLPPVGRVCGTVQFSDTGIIPGSGVGNHRSALNPGNAGGAGVRHGRPHGGGCRHASSGPSGGIRLAELDMENGCGGLKNLMVTPGTSTSRCGIWARSSATASTGPSGSGDRGRSTPCWIIPGQRSGPVFSSKP